MRYRMLSASGDYTFGNGQLNFFINTPDAVLQAVVTALRLWIAEWYLNIEEGTPYVTGVLGKRSQATADATIQSRIRQVQGMVSVDTYTSVLDPVTRGMTITADLNTIYGPTKLQVSNYANY